MADLTREEAVEAMARAGAAAQTGSANAFDRCHEIIQNADRRHMGAALDALLSLLAERGWQVVPVVATEEMAEAAIDAALPKWWRDMDTADKRRKAVAVCTSAAIAAAPAPLSEETPHAR